LFHELNSIELNVSSIEMIYYYKAAIQVVGFVQKFHQKYNMRTLKGNKDQHQRETNYGCYSMLAKTAALRVVFWKRALISCRTWLAENSWASGPVRCAHLASIVAKFPLRT